METSPGICAPIWDESWLRLPWFAFTVFRIAFPAPVASGFAQSGSVVVVFDLDDFFPIGGLPSALGCGGYLRAKFFVFSPLSRGYCVFKILEPPEAFAS